MDSRIVRWLPWLVGGAALVIRCFYLWTFWTSDPFSQRLISDARLFDDWAQHIAGGAWLGPPEVFTLPPLYPYLVGFFYAVFGHAPKGAVVIQALLGGVSAVLVYRLGRRHFGAWAGLIAGILFAGYGPELFFEGMLLGNVGAVFLCLAGLTALDEAVERRDERSRLWFLAGISFGLGALMRPNALSALPFLLFAMWLSGRGWWTRGAFVRAGSRVVGWVLVPLLLCGLRNGLVAHDWMLLTAHGGINFYMGNHAGAPGWFAPPPGMNAQITPEGAQGNLAAPRRIAEAALGRPLKASEVSAFWFRKGLGFWADHPVAALRLTLRKTRLFASGYEVPLNYNFYTQRQYAALLRIPVTALWLLFPLAFLGMAVGLQSFNRHALLYFWVVGYAVGVIAFHVSSRYRTPVVPVLMVFAGYGLWSVIGWVRDRSWRRLACAAGALVVLWTGYRADLNGWMAQSDFGMDAFNLGTAYLWAHEDERALALLKEAEAYKRGGASLYYNLGMAYARTGHAENAEAAYREALAHDPDLVSAYVNLGNILFREGAYDRAIDAYREALSRDAGENNARANMGWALFSLGRDDEARSAWEAVLQSAPTHPSALAGMARLKK